eukprot:753471-Hanusia_phi.AAC.3
MPVVQRLAEHVREGNVETTWRVISCLRRFDRHILMLVFSRTLESSSFKVMKRDRVFESNISKTVAPVLSRRLQERHGLIGSDLSVLAQTTASLFCSQNYSLALRWLSLHDFLLEGSMGKVSQRRSSDTGNELQPVGSLFQGAISGILDSQKDESCFQGAQLLHDIVRIRRRSRAFSHELYDTYIYQARLSMLFHHYFVAISALERILTGQNENDPQALCLLVNAKDSIIELQGQEERCKIFSLFLYFFFLTFLMKVVLSACKSMHLPVFCAGLSPNSRPSAHGKLLLCLHVMVMIMQVARSAAVRERSALQGVRNLGVRNLNGFALDKG